METFAVNKCMASPACAGTAAPALQALGLYFLAGVTAYEPHQPVPLASPWPCCQQCCLFTLENGR